MNPFPSFRVEGVQAWRAGRWAKVSSLDLARHNRGITRLDLDRQRVTVAPGVVLDQLNHHLKPHGFCFGPDVATSSRATLGGMIANNSSGAHVPVHGTTADHVISLTVALADGRLETIGLNEPGLASNRDRIKSLLHPLAQEIQYHACRGPC